MHTLLSASASRREFLGSLLAAGAAWGSLSQVPATLRADEPVAQPPGKKLIVRAETPFNAEGALDRLVADWITPLESFYIRSHGAVPRLDPAACRLTVEGLVERPLNLSIGELTERFPAAQVTATLTCAGNRRNEFTGPKIGGVQWGAGAIGNAEWSGVTLAAVLRHAGVQAAAKHVWFEGADIIVDKSESYPFGGSVPLEKILAVRSDKFPSLLATRMNGQPLTRDHGAPVRTIVPGFIGARSVKWLQKIVVSDRPSPNHYLAHAYKVLEKETPEEIEATAPIYETALNSAICLPTVDQQVAPGALTVRGFALPSGGDGRTIRQVEVSLDDGRSWVTAKIGAPVREFCWVLWSAEVNIQAGREQLLVRATDSSGLTQPREMPWNVKGYQYNAWHRVNLKRA